VHELSICGSIADIVRRHSDQRRVETIHVQVGQLRQIVPGTLVYCWSLVSADTALDGSVLEVEEIPGRISCRDCGHVAEIGPYPVFVCDECRGVEITVLTGEEFLITSLELAEV
jgi:hydrogenase nickel incorporation protein HypA/HybF